MGDRWHAAGSMSNLGLLAQEEGDWEAAREWHERSMKIRTDLGDRPGIAVSLCNLGAVALACGRHADAQSLLERGLELAREMGNQTGILEALAAFADLAAARSLPLVAAKLWGACEGRRAALGIVERPIDHEKRSRQQESIRETTDPTEFEAKMATGRALTVDEMVEFALGKHEARP